jgi:hypothetical protein
MKKIYFVLLLTIFLGFVAGNKASGQPGCENCIAPWSCTTFTLTINCNGVDFPVEYTVCYFCWVTQPRVDAVITRIDGIPIGSDCYYAALQAAENWILEHGIELCGTLPCEVEVKTFRIYQPLCADEIRNPQTNTSMILLNNNCNWKCVSEWEWCWCSCDRNCKKPCCNRPNVMGCVHYELLGRYKETNQACPTFQESENITRCKEIETNCDK